jgi:cell wall-associated NlpC family hydrolase
MRRMTIGILFMVAMFWSVTAYPAADEPYHVVKKGETLSLLAKRHSIGIDELMEINGLSSSKLKAGQKILVRRQGPRIHTVKKGDTLAKIAKKFGMDVDDLAEINEMESLSLKVGQKLYIDENPAALAALEGVDEEDVEKKIQALSESDGPDEKSLPEKLVYFAKKLLNIPYKFGGTSIFGIDCSAYVRKVYGSLGIQLPRTAREQFLTGEAVERDRLSIGDLVFFRTYAGFPSHVGIYLGNNLFIHASAKGRKVAISNLDTPYYLKRFIGAKRLITEETDENKEQG